MSTMSTSRTKPTSLLRFILVVGSSAFLRFSSFSFRCLGLVGGDNIGGHRSERKCPNQECMDKIMSVIKVQAGTKKKTFQGNLPSYLALLKILLISPHESGWILAITFASILFRGFPFSYDFLWGFSRLVKYYHSRVWIKVGCGMNSKLAIGRMEIEKWQWCHFVLVHRTDSTYLSSFFEGGIHLQILQVNTLSRYIKCGFHVLFHLQVHQQTHTNVKRPSHCFCSRQSDISRQIRWDNNTIAEPKSLFTWYS